MYTDYIMVINTDTMFDAEQEYVVVDWTYIDGYSPYQEKFKRDRLQHMATITKNSNVNNRRHMCFRPTNL